MTEVSYPGVYIQEVPSQPSPITGISTSNLGLIGASPKGPVNKALVATSFPEYAAQFGSFTADTLSAHTAYAFFQNGGRVMYFVRVAASDAESSGWDLVATVTDEQITGTASGSGVYDLQLDHMPVSASSLVLTFDNTVNPLLKNVFVSDASGTLTLDTDLSGASAGGGTGVVDLDTGEVHVELTTPADFTGASSAYITATYNYVIFRFEMAWPGVAGNYYRVRIEPGDDDYLVQAQARWTKFNVFLDEDKNEGVLPASWVTIKSWYNLVFDDSTDKSYVATVINADPSEMLTVVDYGNGANPTALQGTSVTAEDIDATQLPIDSTSTAPVDYDNATKGWQYTLANAPFPATLDMSFQFADALVTDKGSPTTEDGTGALLTDSGANFTNGGSSNNLIGYVAVNITKGASGLVTANDATTVTAQLQGGSAHTWATTDVYAILDPTVRVGVGTAAVGGGTETVVSPGTSSSPAAIVPGTVCMKVTMSTAGAQTIVDDGAGNLIGDPDGTPATVATISYTTGQITSAGAVANQVDFDAAWAAETVVAGSDILFGCVYAQPVAVEADADGNMSLSTTQATGYPSKFSLNTASGVNEVDMDTGVVQLTWKIAGNPSLGPAGSYAQTATYYTNPSSSITATFTGGADGTAVTSADVVDPSLAVDQHGIYAFGQVDEMMTLVAADFQTDTYVANALVTYAELMKDKFVPLTVPYGLTYQEAINWKKFTLSLYNSYAALYYPHVKILDPVSQVNTDIPCGGHVAGVYARTDANFNVGKAPAGVGDGDLRWCVGLERSLTQEQVGLIYKQKINALVDWNSTGRVVWGARTLEIEGGEHVYIQGRRTFMFVEKSVYNATHVHVFKNNGPSLWNAIRTQVASFMLGLHNSGYFAGTTPDESYFVICDRTNNPQNTVDQGLVYCDVGIATNKPAEFIVFRFSAKALA